MTFPDLLAEPQAIQRKGDPSVQPIRRALAFDCPGNVASNAKKSGHAVNLPMPPRTERATADAGLTERLGGG